MTDLGRGRKRRSRTGHVVAAVVAAVAVALALAYVLANRTAPEAKPYLTFLGGGFIFNYRIAEVTYGFTAEVTRPLPVGTIIEATFEDPAGGEPLLVQARVVTERLRYSLTSPPVEGVVAGRPYHVTVRLIARDGDKILGRYERDYVSQVGQEVMPEGPLTIGPGYQRPPPRR
ncbi:MAG TPA: hypothetical protein VK844_07840 [Hyphomicrobiales bacterium]|nr:hypothetical protein [Hyphomicrobiales bacterium]